MMKTEWHNNRNPEKMEETKKEWTAPEITSLEIKETEQLLPPDNDQQDDPPFS